MFISCQAIKSVTISISAIALFISTGLGASAQTYTSAANGQNGFAGYSYVPGSSAFMPRKFNGSQKVSYRAADLKDPVAAPYLPAYSGQGSKYTGGVYYPYLKGRQCYVMHYLAKDSRPVLLHSYKTSLINSGWQIDAMQSGTNRLTAIRKENGLCLSLYANDSSVKGFKSSFEIKYLTNGSIQTH